MRLACAMPLRTLNGGFLVTIPLLLFYYIPCHGIVDRNVLQLFLCATSCRRSHTPLEQHSHGSPSVSDHHPAVRNLSGVVLSSRVFCRPRDRCRQFAGFLRSVLLRSNLPWEAHWRVRSLHPWSDSSCHSCRLLRFRISEERHCLGSPMPRHG